MVAPRRLTRRPALALAACVAALGLWQLGTGLYIPAKALVAQALLHDAWRRTLAGATRVKPWPWADTWPVARLRAPAHNVDQIVLAGASGRTLAFGPGHLDGTPEPGAVGNSIIGGHRDTSLAFLERVAVGERLVVETADGARIAYRVTGHRVVDASRPWPSPEVAERRLTLVTCYPFDAIVPGGKLRYLVFARAEPD
jgi:sortase A